VDPTHRELQPPLECKQSINLISQIKDKENKNNREEYGSHYTTKPNNLISQK
jgi:hypothetical protein